VLAYKTVKQRAGKIESRIPWGPLWFVLWRLLIFGPILMLIGVLVLAAVIASFVAPPFYAFSLAIEGRFITGAVVFLIWLGWLVSGRKLLRWLLQGMEYSSL
jgi:hypothetical protein